MKKYPWKKISLWAISFFYTVAGINHFLKPQTYMKIMPPVFPEPLLLIYISGVAESALGIAMLFPKTRNLAAWGIVSLLFAVFPANIYMYQLGEKTFGIAQWILGGRLVFQGVLVYWAYSFTDHSKSRNEKRSNRLATQ